MSVPLTSTGKLLVLSTALIAAAALIAIGATSGHGDNPTRVFKLRYQDDSILVPAGETWRLSWTTPYSVGEVTPAYDVRILEGAPWLGDNREIQAETYVITTEKKPLLDLRAGRGRAVVWLEGGTRFATANDLLQIEVQAYSAQISTR
jgi:hypothetical protein